MATIATIRAPSQRLPWNRKDTRGGIDNNTNARVAIVIDNELLNYITGIELISDRIMLITLGHIMPVTFISNYSPTATNYTIEEKIEHYDKLKKTYRERGKNKNRNTSGTHWETQERLRKTWGTPRNT